MSAGSERESTAAALLAKLDWVGDATGLPTPAAGLPTPPKPGTAFTPAGVVLPSSRSTHRSRMSGPVKTAEEEEQELMVAVRKLEDELAVEDAEIAQLMLDEERDAEALARAEAERADLESQLQQHRRTEARQHASAKLLQLQLTVATQLYGVAESLSHVASTSAAKPQKSAAGGGVAMADALRHRDREVAELRRALKRQQQLVADAHRQLLELTTRKRPLGAAAAASDDVNELRAALAEQEMRRLMAEARSDELQAQVRLFEEQGLRLRLHPPPPGEEEAHARAQAAALASPTSKQTTRVAVDLVTPGEAMHPF